MFDVRGLNLAIEIWGAVFCLVGIAVTSIFSRASRKYRGHLLALFALELLTLGADAIAGICRGKLDTLSWVGTHAGNLATFVGSYLLLAAFTAYLCVRLSELSRETRRYTVWSNIVWVLAVVWSIMCALGLFYTIDEANIYHRDKLYWVSQILVVLVSAINTAHVLFNRESLRLPTLLAMLFYTLGPLVAAVVQARIYGLNFGAVAAVLGTIIIFLETQAYSAQVLLERNEELARSQMALAESRIAVMVSQIQPHFMFNTLDTIYQLCEEDPARAQKAIDAFSTFLRANLDSLKQNAPVPIEAELRHVRTYLDLEKMSFEELLDYRFDIGAGGFKVPALCVQTLAENAVKHGVSKRSEGGTVTIRTRETKVEYLVTVADDGVGFDADVVLLDGGGLGIDNTRARVEAMCGGTLTITSSPGKGTTAVISIPKEKTR